MACRAGTRTGCGLTGARWRAAILLVVCAAGLPGQPPTPLDQVAARKEPDFSPAMEGKPVVVTGQISIRPTHVLDYVHLAIQDKGAGLVLEGKGTQFDQFSPGDWVEARGRVARRGGLPVVVVLKITTVTGGAAPEPRRVKVEDLQSFQYLGLRVNVEGRVVELGENAGGSYLRLGNPENPLKVFLPAPPAGAARKFAGFSVGDRVRVTGVSYQYCANPPYDRHFEVLVDNLSAVELLGHGWGFQIWAYKQWLVALVVPVLIWWYRERNAKAQREMLRTMYGLGEEILEAGSSGEISGRLAAVVPKVFPLTGVRLYFYDRGLKTFNCVTPRLGEKTAEAQSGAFSLESPAGLVESGVAACFENRNLLVMADTRRGPFSLSAREKVVAPRALLFVPMLAQGEPLGVLQFSNEHKARNFSPDEKAAAQHLANQVAVAVKLLQQKSVREQLSRNEKLAAMGRLISGVVNDLQTPIASISSMAEAAIENHPGSAPGHELLVIASEAQRASAIVQRLVSFAQPEQVQAEPVEMNQLLRSLIQFREREWKACGIQLRNLLKEQPLFVMGSQGQLEQVFLNLLVHAEQSLEDATEKRLTVRADVLAKRVFIEIGYNAAELPGAARRTGADSLDAEVNALGLDVCRSIVTGHGGEMRLVHAPGRESTFEIELPWLPMDQAVAHAEAVQNKEPARRWTAMLVEPEEWVERQLLEMLSARGYRVVPVRSSDEGLDLVGRLRFDVVLCSTRLPGLNWVEYFDRVRGRVGAFVLLAEAFSHDLSMHFRGEGRWALLKPIEKNHFERTFEAVEARLLSAEAKASEIESKS